MTDGHGWTHLCAQSREDEPGEPQIRKKPEIGGIVQPGMTKKEIAYKMRLSGASYAEIALVIFTAATNCRKYVSEYCEQNGLRVPERVPINQKAYEMALDGKNSMEIADALCEEQSKVSSMIHKYCKIRGLENPLVIMKKEPRILKMYKLLMKGYEYADVARSFGITKKSLYSMIHSYVRNNKLDKVPRRR
jgi:DNA-binding CsgD family transcriptional regulator